MFEVIQHIGAIAACIVLGGAWLVIIFVLVIGGSSKVLTSYVASFKAHRANNKGLDALSRKEYDEYEALMREKSRETRKGQIQMRQGTRELTAGMLVLIFSLLLIAWASTWPNDPLTSTLAAATDVSNH